MDKADIQRAALFRFAAQGYHATTVRHLTKDLAVTPAAFYYHFKSKDDLLASLIEEIITKDLEVLHRIRSENQVNPLDELLYIHVYFICAAREEALVVMREAKYLEEDFRNRAVRMFHEYESVFSDCIAEEYELSGGELTLATRAVVGLGGSVVQWYHQDGPLGADEVARSFARYARGMLERAEQDASGAASSRGRGRRSRNGSGRMSFEDTVAVVNRSVAARRGAAGVVQTPHASSIAAVCVPVHAHLSSN